ncbi:MAG: PTH1 family peptidyl-tRNA hydrolase [Cryomorphaceae bacterium]|jgi:PTH1 family peptidyl-tRNA hydrolase
MMQKQAKKVLKEKLLKVLKKLPKPKLKIKSNSADILKYLVVGLGNVGVKYLNTRHNIGFKVADALAERSATSFSEDRYGAISSIKHRGRTLIVLKPNTFMNLSGKAVNYWLQKEKIPLERLLVVTDDLALPYGKQRLRMKGSDGGHNGLKDTNAILGRQDYARLRIGIGDEFHKGGQIDYVLGEWSMPEEKTLEERIDVAVDTCLSFCSIGGPQTMTAFNNK